MDKSNVRMDKGCMQKNIKIKRNCLSYMGSVCTLTCIVLTIIEKNVTMYKTTLLPTIDYGNIFLTACTIKELEKLQVVQNNAIRCCLNIPYPRMEHVQVVHDMTNIKKVKERRSTHLLTCVHRAVLNRKLNLVERERQTRANVAPLIDCGMPRTKTIKKHPTSKAA